MSAEPNSAPKIVPEGSLLESEYYVDLGKSESDNLRDFARSMGSLAALSPVGENRAQY
jgi:hypothetical protein